MSRLRRHPLGVYTSRAPTPTLLARREDDKNWPEPDRNGRQEFEVVLGNQHISFAVRRPPPAPTLTLTGAAWLQLRPPRLRVCAAQTAKIGSLLDVQESKDPEGLRIFYYLVQVLATCCGC